MSLAFIFNCDQMALYCSENKVFDSFLEQVFVLFFLDVCRESVPESHASVQWAVIHFCDIREIIFYFDLRTTLIIL